MQSSESTKRRRVRLIQMMLSIRRAINEADGETTISLIRMAIRMGSYQGKPFDVTDLASATGLPRTTVLRHLVELRTQGIVKSVRVGRRTIPILLPAADDDGYTDRLYEHIERLVKDAASNLSKMDS